MSATMAMAIDLEPRRTPAAAKDHAERLDPANCLLISGRISARIEGLFDAWDAVATKQILPHELSRVMLSALDCERQQWARARRVYDGVALSKMAELVRRYREDQALYT